LPGQPETDRFAVMQLNFQRTNDEIVHNSQVGYGSAASFYPESTEDILKSLKLDRTQTWAYFIASAYNMLPLAKLGAVSPP
jgi:hypothetical protein